MKEIVFRNNMPQFVIERQDNCIALIPVKIYAQLLLEQSTEEKQSESLHKHPRD